jgi:hypothetical protein
LADGAVDGPLMVPPGAGVVPAAPGVTGALVLGAELAGAAVSSFLLQAVKATASMAATIKVLVMVKAPLCSAKALPQLGNSPQA